MDYERIYREFIADRRSKPSPEGYSESHHVIPKSMGGGDEKANLIDLTPEDHYFAHLCLAKAYGGTQWTAVVMMGTSRTDGARRWVRARPMYGAARRKSAVEMSIANAGQEPLRGADNGMHDATEHLWTNVDTGAVQVATKWAMWSMHGGCRGHWTSAVSGDRRTMLGWTPMPELVRVRSSKGREFRFKNQDGPVFIGTQSAFAQHAGLSAASASRIARGLSSSPSGWRVEDKDAAAA